MILILNWVFSRWRPSPSAVGRLVDVMEGQGGSLTASTDRDCGARIKPCLGGLYAAAGEGDRGYYPHRHPILSGAELHLGAQAVFNGWAAITFIVIWHSGPANF